MYCYVAQATSEEQTGSLVVLPHGVAPGGVYRAPFVAVGPVSSYLTFPPLPSNVYEVNIPGGLFLLHFP